MQAAGAEAARQAREVRAAEARAKLEMLKSNWKENQNIQAAAAAGDSGKMRKQKVHPWGSPPAPEPAVLVQRASFDFCPHGRDI